MAVRQKPRNYRFYDNFSHYVPGVADIFILLAWLIAGAFLGSLISFPLLSLGESATDYAMLISYPVQFIPAMIYASHKSHTKAMNHQGVKVDSNNFKPVGAVVCAVMVIFATIAAAYCSDAITAVLPDMPKALEDLLKGMTTGTLWANFLCVSIFAPFFEEWLCRGMVLRGLLGNGMKPVWAIVISAAFFAIIHMNPWQAVPAFLLGCLFGYVYYKTGSLKLTMLMHFTNNTFSLAMSHVDSLKDMDTWMDVLPGAKYWVIFAAALLVVAVTVVAFRKIQLKSETGNCDSVPALFDGE